MESRYKQSRKWVLFFEAFWYALTFQLSAHVSLNKYILVCVQSYFSHEWLCDPMDCSLPGSSVHGILQARILEWVAMPSSRGSFQTRDQTHVSCVSWIAGRFFITEPSRKPYIYHTYILKEKEIEWDTWGSIVDRMVLGLILPSFFFTFSKFSEKKKKKKKVMHL